MKYILKEMPSSYKPREKLLKYGSKALDDFELLAIIFRTGTKDKSVLDMSMELTNELTSLSDLQNITYEELINIKGIGKAKALTLLATIELGKRITNYKQDNYIIKETRDAYNYLKNEMSYLTQETFVALYLTIKGEVIAKRVISIGTTDRTIATPKDVITWGLKYACFGILIAHNHPSGNSTPSKEDLHFTMDLIHACALVDIKVIDHIIIGKNNYFSIGSNKKYNDK